MKTRISQNVILEITNEGIKIYTKKDSKYLILNYENKINLLNIQQIYKILSGDLNEDRNTEL